MPAASAMCRRAQSEPCADAAEARPRNEMGVSCVRTGVLQHHNRPKDFRGIFVFHNAETMNRFIEEGWAFGGQADAAAKASDKGGAVGGEITVDNITIYQLTETGLALQATIKGTKYLKDDSLN